MNRSRLRLKTISWKFWTAILAFFLTLSAAIYVLQIVSELPDVISDSIYVINFFGSIITIGLGFRSYRHEKRNINNIQEDIDDLSEDIQSIGGKVTGQDPYFLSITEDSESQNIHQIVDYSKMKIPDDIIDDAEFLFENGRRHIFSLAEYVDYKSEEIPLPVSAYLIGVGATVTSTEMSNWLQNLDSSHAVITEVQIYIGARAIQEREANSRIVN